MVESCPSESSRPQTLLEAAKAFGEAFDLPRLGSRQAANLRAAIAREEANPYRAGYAAREIEKAMDRAQQAESSAAWWKSEGERLSAELAKVRSATDRPSSFHTYLSEIRAELQSDDSHATVAAAKAMRERAEKAESELQSLRTTLASAHSMPADTPTKELIGKFWETINGNAELLSRTGHELPLKVSKVLPLVVDELLRLRDELVHAGSDRVVAAQEACDLRARAMRAEAEAASERKKHADFAAKVMDQDLKAAMGGPQVGIVRDPVTGWTFDTMRQQFDAARTTVRVLAAELVAARQQIAGTKGFEG